MSKYQIELFSNQLASWITVAELRLRGEQSLGTLAPCDLEYDLDYCLAHPNAHGEQLLGIKLPASLALTQTESWPGFAVDLLPSGTAREYWVRKLNIPSGASSDWSLLSHSGSQPVGNIRIKSSLNEREAKRSKRPFTLEQIKARDRSFIDYLIELDEPISTFTGANGASPKVLMRVGKDGLFYADAVLPDSETARLLLLKFPMEDHSTDRDILRAEGAIGKFLRDLGFKEAPAIEAHEDLLIIERFDRFLLSDGRILRYGMESFYSALGIPGHGRKMDLFDAIEMLKDTSSAPTDDCLSLIERDVLNIVFNNTDVHGRNSSLIKIGSDVRLSPIYDLAPMGYHKDAITRSTLSHWGDFDNTLPPYEEIAFEIERRFGLRLFKNAMKEKMMKTVSQLRNGEERFKRRLVQAGVGREMTGKILDNFTRVVGALNPVAPINRLQKDALLPLNKAKIESGDGPRKKTMVQQREERYCASGLNCKNPAGATKLKRNSRLCSLCDPKNTSSL